MGVSDRYSNKRSPRVELAMVAAISWLSGCVETLPPLTGTNSFEVSLAESVFVGSKESRLAVLPTEAEIGVRAIGMDGEFDPSFSGKIQIRVHYLGSIGVPGDRGRPLAEVEVKNGIAENVQVGLPTVYGPTVLWVDDAENEQATLATGTSDAMWFRNPFLAEISTPSAEESFNALSRSPLETKQVRVTESRYGARGRLVVTGVYPEGYTVSDVECQDEDGTPPCVAGAYDHLYVFAFGLSTYEGGGALEVGHTISGVSGPVSEFNGLTELSFPQTYATDQKARLEIVPEPVVISNDSLAAPIQMERLEAGLVAVEGGTVCPLDKNYQSFSQWKLDIGQGCSKGVAVISKGVVSGFDPADFVGQSIPKIVGTLRPINLGRFNVWLMYPRNRDDLVLP